MQHFGVYITDSGNFTRELPVAPEEIKFLRERNNEIVDVLKLGEVNLIGESKLDVIDISSTFPVEPWSAVNFTTAQNVVSGGNYIDQITEWESSKKAGLLVVSGDSIRKSIRCTVDSFEWGFANGNIDEYVYTLRLRRWRDFRAKKVAVIKQKPFFVPKFMRALRPAPPAQIGVGSVVVVNGQLHGDSYGASPGVVEREAKRIVNFTAAGRACPYHVTTMEGGWRGWVTADSVRLA